MSSSFRHSLRTPAGLIKYFLNSLRSFWSRRNDKFTVFYPYIFLKNLKKGL